MQEFQPKSLPIGNVRVPIRHPVLRESVLEPQVDVAARVFAVVVQRPHLCDLAGREHSQVRRNGVLGGRAQLSWRQNFMRLTWR